MYTPEENKIHQDIATSLGLTLEEVEKATMLYNKGIVEKIKEDVPCEIIMPYLGRLSPTKKYVEDYETSNTRGRISSIQSGG